MIYADSSALAKRYYDESGTRIVRNRWAGAGRVFTSRVAYAEVHASFARKRRERGVSSAQFESLARAFESEWPSYDQIVVDGSTLGNVRLLLKRYALRGFDAIHLSAALWLRRELGEPVEFWVSDERRQAAAEKERLTVVNPEQG